MRTASTALITMALLLAIPLHAETLADVLTTHKIPVNVFSADEQRPAQSPASPSQQHTPPILPYSPTSLTQPIENRYPTINTRVNQFNRMNNGINPPQISRLLLLFHLLLQTPRQLLDLFRFFDHIHRQDVLIRLIHLLLSNLSPSPEVCLYPPQVSSAFHSPAEPPRQPAHLHPSPPVCSPSSYLPCSATKHHSLPTIAVPVSPKTESPGLKRFQHY